MLFAAVLWLTLWLFVHCVPLKAVLLVVLLTASGVFGQVVLFGISRVFMPALPLLLPAFIAVFVLFELMRERRDIREQQTRMRLSEALAVERMRLRIADDLHDDIGSELSAIALEGDLVARRLPAKDPGRRRISSIAGAVREEAENLRDVVWIMNPDQDKIQDLVARMRATASKMLPELRVRFRMGIGFGNVPLEMEFKRHVFLIFKEILHNIVKHAEATSVDVEMELNEEILHLCVKDNGVGFDASAKTEGHGICSLRSRAETIGGTLTIESMPGSGTTVRFKARIARS